VCLETRRGCGCAENSIPDALFFSGAARRLTRFFSRADVKHHTLAIQAKRETERELAETKLERGKIRAVPRVWHESSYCSICLSISSTRKQRDNAFLNSLAIL